MDYFGKLLGFGASPETASAFIPEGSPLPPPSGNIIDYEQYIILRDNNRHRVSKVFKFTEDWPYLNDKNNSRNYKYRDGHIVFLKPEECSEQNMPNRSCMDITSLISEFQRQSASKRRGSFSIPIPKVYSNSSDEDKMKFIEAYIAQQYFLNQLRIGGRRKSRKAHGKSRRRRASRRN